MCRSVNSSERPQDPGQNTAIAASGLAILPASSSNLSQLTYSLQRASTSETATFCDGSSGTYTEIARPEMERNADTTHVIDFNRPNGHYCYRAGTPNPVTGTTAFGYSNPAKISVP